MRSIHVLAVLAALSSVLPARAAACTAEEGQLLIEEGRYAAAIRVFGCIDGAPTEVDGYRGRIEAEVLAGRFSDAVRDYARVTAKWFFKYAAAIHLLRHLVELRPDDVSRVLPRFLSTTPTTSSSSANGSVWSSVARRPSTPYSSPPPDPAKAAAEARSACFTLLASNFLADAIILSIVASKSARGAFWPGLAGF
jgi:hypothetical protein